MSDGAGKAKMTDNAREGGARSTTGSRITRRTFLKGAVSLGVASLGAPLLWQAPALAARKVPGAGATASAASSYIKHVIVYSQENRSFDHYYGYASAIKNDPQFAKWAIPDGYYQPNGRKKVVPWHFTTRSTPDVGHSWTSVHGEWNNGKMDGFYKTDGMNAMGYYTQDPTKNIDDLLFYYGLFNDSAALCVNYFCSVLGPT